MEEAKDDATKSGNHTYRSLKSFGERYEYVAISELLKRGYDVYKTLVDDQGIDCIIRKTIDSKPYYIDLQIKARSKNCAAYDAARFAAMDIKEPRDNYLFLFYSEWLDTSWIFPSLELYKLASQNKNGKNIGKSHILLSGMSGMTPIKNKKYEKYEGDNGFNKIEEVFRNLGGVLSSLF
jgi:hypothetical protein